MKYLAHSVKGLNELSDNPHTKQLCNTSEQVLLQHCYRGITVRYNNHDRAMKGSE